MEKASSLFENLYKCIRQTALSDPYKAADETYYKILVPEKNSKGKGVRKGYLWVVVGINTRMIYLLYDDGSRSERVILNELGSCKGIIKVTATHLTGNSKAMLIPISHASRACNI